MNKFYKHKLYKKYNDEIWGKLAVSKKFSYNKKRVLFSYRDMMLRGRLRVRTKFSYFRRGFLKHLNWNLFQFKFFKKRIKVINFLKKKVYFSHMFVRSSKKRFNKIKPSLFLGLNISFILLLNSSRSNKHFVRLVKRSAAFQKRLVPVVFPKLFLDKKRVLLKTTKFLRLNNLKFTIKKKLNLKRQKTFFYSIHIAAPRKKNKKWSLFGLKNIYYKKVSLFFGFKRVSSFLKLYNLSLGVWGRNESEFFLLLEGRLETFLMRLNFFPSIYFLKRFISFGNVFVNNVKVCYPSYFLSYNEIVSINKKYFKSVYFFLKSSIKFKRILLNLPTFIEADYKLLVAMLIRRPTQVSLTLPVSFNLYTKFPSFHK